MPHPNNDLIEPSRKGGLYVIRLSDTHYYGGRAKNFRVRWKDHLRALREGRHDNSRVQATYNKYGRFEPTVFLSMCDDASDESRRGEEQKWLDKHFRKPGCLNLSPFSDGGCSGHTEETRRKMSETRKSRPDLLAQARESLSRNRVHLDPQKKIDQALKMCESHKGKKQSPEQIAKRVKAHLGRKNTPETRAQMSESAKRQAIAHPTSHGSETRALISIQQKGRVWVNNGLRNSRMFPDSISVGWSVGRI
jgi:group I intron endonuclease